MQVLVCQVPESLSRIICFAIIPLRLPMRRLTNVDNQPLIGLIQSAGTLNPTHSARFYTLMATIDGLMEDDSFFQFFSMVIGASAVA